MTSSLINNSDLLQINVVKQDLVKSDVALKGYLVVSVIFSSMPINLFYFLLIGGNLLLFEIET